MPKPLLAMFHLGECLFHHVGENFDINNGVVENMLMMKKIDVVKKVGPLHFGTFPLYFNSFYIWHMDCYWF